MATKSRKILVGKEMRKNEKHISSEEIARAIRAFKTHGGLIKTLPPEQPEKRSQVGNRWESPYENVLDY